MNENKFFQQNYWNIIKRSTFLIVFSIVFCSYVAIPSPVIKNEGVKYLRNVVNRFSGLNDYIVDVRVHLDLENIQAPDMEARIFYKAPDRVKINSTGIFVLPKEIGIFNPRKFDPGKFNVQLLDTLSCDGDPCVKVSLIPEADKLSQNIVLVIDKKDWLIKEISSRLPRGVEMKAKITYGTFKSFSLPTLVEVDLSSPDQNLEQEGRARDMRFRAGTKGKVMIYYSNYKVNSGLSDSIFVKGQSH